MFVLEEEMEVTENVQEGRKMSVKDSFKEGGDR